MDELDIALGPGDSIVLAAPFERQAVPGLDLDIRALGERAAGGGDCAERLDQPTAAASAAASALAFHPQRVASATASALVVSRSWLRSFPFWSDRLIKQSPRVRLLVKIAHF
jgi:hypothetical protein